jgi:sigma-B regulation protein RsbU (phosphoserine phosphatase)
MSQLATSPLPLGAPSEATLALLAAIQELQAAPDLRTGLAAVAENLRGCLHFDNLSVLLLDELGRELRFELAVGLPQEVADHWRFGLGQGIVGTVAREGRPLRVGDVLEDPRYIRATEGVRSELAVPLVVRGRTIGVLDAGSSLPHCFTEENERLLTFVAGFLANAIENAQVHRNLLDQAQTLSVLHEVGRELNGILDRRRLLEKVAELLQRLIDYDLFSVMLWNEDRRLLEPWMSYQRDGRELAGIASLPLGMGLCGTAAALRQPIRVPNVHLDPRYARCKTGIEVNSELVVPLVLKDRLLGTLDLESSRYDAFSARHEQLLSTLASTLAIALENARLYERLSEDDQKIRGDLATAREIQAQLLPKASPWVPGLQVGFAWESARDLGGDFYDFLTYGEGRLAVAVGDVAGKSTAAALYGSFAVGTLREYATRGIYRPAQVLADMSCKLRELRIDHRFLAMTFAVWDSAAQTLTIASSGLPYPYHLVEGEVRNITVHGVPLGVLACHTYDEVALTLHPGESVVFCSDGIEECRNAQDEELGSQRVQEILRSLAGATASEIAQGLLEAVRRHSGTAEIYDDRTIVVLKAS